MILKRWPFGWCAFMLLMFNLWRMGNDTKLRVWNDPVCAVFFVGYLLCCAIAISIRTPAPSGD